MTKAVKTESKKVKQAINTLAYEKLLNDARRDGQREYAAQIAKKKAANGEASTHLITDKMKRDVLALPQDARVRVASRLNAMAGEIAKTPTKSPRMHRIYWWDYSDGRGETELFRDASGQFYIQHLGSTERRPCTIAEGLLWYAENEADQDPAMDGSPGDNGLGIGELLTEAAKALQPTPGKSAITEMVEYYLKIRPDLLELCPIVLDEDSVVHLDIEVEAVARSFNITQEKAAGVVVAVALKHYLGE